MIGQGRVDSILKYQAIGFDMDHTFLRYKLRNFTKLVNQATSIFLVSKKAYPQEIFVNDEEDAHRKYKMAFRAVYDHKTGNILKIGSNQLIMRGYFGWRQLTKDEIIKTYGKNPILQDYEILSGRHPDFTNLHEFYGTSLVPLLAQIVHLKTEGKFEVLNSKNYYDIWKDIDEALDYNYNIPDVEAFKRADYKGYFYPKLLTEPRHYINKTSKDLIDRLKKLKERGVKVFIASNNFYEVANILMTEAMGKDWLDLFSFCIFNAKKPSFFTERENPRKYLGLDRQPIIDPNIYFQGDRKGVDKVILEGNALQFNDYLYGHVSKDFKVLFFGDTIVSDCAFAFSHNHRAHWDIGFIMEELQEMEHGYPEKEYFGYWQYWGSAILDKNIYSGVDKTIIFNFADNTAHRTFSMLEGPECVDFLTI